MSKYIRAWMPGGTWFFTVNLLQRGTNNLLTQNIDHLRIAVKKTQLDYPFAIHGWVVLPDHLHCIISLPADDTDYPVRWRLIKSRFSLSLPRTESRSDVRQMRGERGIWQRRYWEHLIRDEHDYTIHMNYIHMNPIKHKLVARVSDWPYSSFHRLVMRGIYPSNWHES